MFGRHSSCQAAGAECRDSAVPRNVGRSGLLIRTDFYEPSSPRTAATEAFYQPPVHLKGEEIMRKRPKVSIIIINWNGLQDTTECLESVRQITYENYDVTLVDNGSEGRDAHILKEGFGDWVHVIENERNDGFAEGNNIGMRRALKDSDPDYVLLLNNDTIVDPAFLTELVDVAESDPEIGIVGPKIYYYDSPTRIHFAGGIYFRRTGQSSHIGQDEKDQGQFDETKETGYITACALLIKRRVIEDVGLLDRGYFIYYEELDWAVRAREKGHRIVFVPRARVWHRVSRASGLNTPFYTYFMTRGRIRFVRKNASMPAFVLLFLPYFLAFRFAGPLVLFLIQRRWRAIKALIAGTRDGMSGRLENPQTWS
ncbi:MAG: glycosyltransferase family 2 protein [Thermoplasmata archaeon]